VHIYAEIDKLYWESNQITLDFEHADHATIVAAAHKVRTMDERYEEIKRTVLANYPLDNQAQLA